MAQSPGDTRSPGGRKLSLSGRMTLIPEPKLYTLGQRHRVWGGAGHTGSGWRRQGRYLVPLIAPSPAHAVGPDRGEEGQVIAVGLGQEHRLLWVQGQAGTGVPLLGNGTEGEQLSRWG